MLALTAGPVRAQRVLGAGETADAYLLPRGVAAFALSQSFAGYAERFGASGDREPLFAQYNAESFGVSAFPALRSAQTDVQTLAGVTSGLDLSLGPLRTRADALVKTARADLRIGLARWLEIGATVPFVVTRVDISATLNGTGIGANVGVNPARAGTDSQTVAVDQNRALAVQLDTAFVRLQRRRAGCATGCEPIDALIQEAAGYRAAVTRTFGDVDGGGAAFVPVRGSEAQKKIYDQLTNFSGRVVGQLGAGNEITARPYTPLIPVTSPDLDLLAASDAAGVSGGELGAIEHGYLGDAEVHARLRLFDTFGGNGDRRISPTGLNLRAAITGTFRLGTGHPDTPDDLFDVGTGDGQNDVEVGGTLDALFGSRAWASVSARYTVQLADRLPRRITDAPTDAFPEAFRLQTVDRDLGDVLELEIAPRYALTDYFGVEAFYSLRRKGADKYSGVFDLTADQTGGDPIALDAASLGVGTEQREHRVGWSLAYSTLRGAHGRRPRVPFEVSLSHFEVVRGSGYVPRMTSNRLQVRVYSGLLGGRPAL